MHIYVDIIPAKLYFRIEATNEVDLLGNIFSDIEISNEELWIEIQKEHDLIATPNATASKTLSISSLMEELNAKHKSIKLAIVHLHNFMDLELIEMIQRHRYKFRSDYSSIEDGALTTSHKEFQADLERIARESNALQIRIKNVSKRLPKQKKSNKGKNIPFDEVVLSYAAFTGLGFINPNLITLSAYYAMINVGNEQMKQMKNGGKQ